MANSSEATHYNCTPTERAAACDPEAPPPDPKGYPVCLACARQAATAHNCTAAEAEEGVEPAPEATDGAAEAMSAPAAAEPPATGAVIVVPGSTDESQPGGSTKPPTTPDD